MHHAVLMLHIHQPLPFMRVVCTLHASDSLLESMEARSYNVYRTNLTIAHHVQRGRGARQCNEAAREQDPRQQA